VVAADVLAEARRVGCGGWTSYTCSTGGLSPAGLESLLGFRVHRPRLLIDPCSPRAPAESPSEVSATFSDRRGPRPPGRGPFSFAHASKGEAHDLRSLVADRHAVRGWRRRLRRLRAAARALPGQGRERRLPAGHHGREP